MADTASNLQVPDYLNDDFFLGVLIRVYKENRIDIKETRAELGCAVGDNYVSKIYRITIQFTRDDKDDEVSFVVKTLPLAKELSIVRDLKVYDKEKTMCMDVIPQLETILGDVVKLGPKCYYGTPTPIQTIVFEDLKPGGFRNASRQLGLDEAHCNLVMKRLGQFHAASLVLHKQNPDIVEQFSYGIFSNLTIENITLIPGSIKHLGIEISSWTGFEEISAKVKKLHENFKDVMMKLVARKDNEFRVLNHGDLWVNNIMFKYDNSELDIPLDLVMVDHQMTYFSSPGIDINYFLNTSPLPEVLKEKREELIQVYYASLLATLRKLNYDEVPKYSTIKNEIRAKELYGFVAAAGIMPIIAREAEKCESDILEFKNKGNEKYLDLFSSQRFKDTMGYVLKRFDQLGVFDI